MMPPKIPQSRKHFLSDICAKVLEARHDCHEKIPRINPVKIDSKKIQQLKNRAKIISATRSFFENLEFSEIQTPLLVSNPGLEPHLELFKTELTPGMGLNARKTLFLPTSPEYHLKKALAAGFEKIFEITRSFRNGELGTKHQPEFCMLEWYRAPGNYQDIARDFENLCTELATKVELNPLWKKSEHISVREAFIQFSGIDLNPILEGKENLATRARACGLDFVDGTDSFSTAFNKIIVERVEPKLGHDGVAFLWDYPASEAALSRKKNSDPLYCERFEVYWQGIELANAFGELTDSKEQRARCQDDQKTRLRLYGETPPLDEEFLACLDHLKRGAGGIAVGMDRLIMCMLGAQQIEEIIAFPHEN